MDASVVSPARRDSLRAAVWGWWVAARGDQRLTYLVGAGLILIGLAQVDLLDARHGPRTGGRHSPARDSE